MEDRRRREDRPWRGCLLGVLAGLVLALLCLTWLERRSGPAPAEFPVGTAGQEGQNSVGVEFSLRFRVLLPQGEK